MRRLRAFFSINVALGYRWYTVGYARLLDVDIDQRALKLGPVSFTTYVLDDVWTVGVCALNLGELVLWPRLRLRRKVRA